MDFTGHFPNYYDEVTSHNSAPKQDGLGQGQRCKQYDNNQHQMGGSDQKLGFNGRVEAPNKLVLPAEWNGMNARNAFDALRQLPLDQLVDKSLIIDLSEVDHIDSLGLGAIIGLRKKLISQRVNIQLAGANSHVRRLLNIANFDRLFSIT